MIATKMENEDFNPTIRNITSQEMLVELESS